MDLSGKKASLMLLPQFLGKHTFTAGLINRTLSATLSNGRRFHQQPVDERPE